jgi:phosphonate metabolism protein PhnN/1,5-bisphosphokinase (PRPP-forming)
LAAVKDTIIEGPKLELRRDTQFSFSQRHIKRPAHSSSEAHSAISKDIFLSEHSSGRYIFSWETHGNLYGFPACIEDDITTGKTVVLNVSRTIVSESRKKLIIPLFSTCSWLPLFCDTSCETTVEKPPTTLH